MHTRPKDTDLAGSAVFAAAAVNMDWRLNGISRSIVASACTNDDTNMILVVCEVQEVRYTLLFFLR